MTARPAPGAAGPRRLRRRARMAVVAVVTVFAAMVGGTAGAAADPTVSGEAPPPAGPGREADLRVVGAAPGAGGLPVRVDGELVAEALDFGAATAAVPVAPGRHAVAVGAAVATVEARAGCTTNVVVAERPAGSAPTLVAAPGCATGRIPDGAARLTVLVTSDEPGAVRVTAGPVGPIEVAPFAVSAPLHPAAGETTVVLASAASGAEYAAVPVELAAGTATLAVFAGGGDTAFRLFAVFDGAQPADPPAGVDINTGLPDGPARVEAAPFVVAGGLAVVAGLLALARALAGLPARAGDAGRRRPAVTARRGAAALAVLALLAGAGACAREERPGDGPAAAEVDAGGPGETADPGGAGGRPATTNHGRVPGGPEPALVTAAPDPVPDPVRVAIPALGIDAPAVALEAGQADDLVAELAPGDAGWFRDPAPGTVGVATVVGHTGRNGVFGRLADLPAGSEVVVTDRAGGRHRFRTAAPATYRKGAIPAAAWGPVRRPALVLVSCTGPLRADGLHRDNVVVWAAG